MNTLERIDSLLDSLSRYRSSADYHADPIPFQAAREVLLDLLNDQDPAARESAVRALGSYVQQALDIGALSANDIGFKARMGDAIWAKTSDDDWGTRQSAAEMVVRLGCVQREDARALLAADLETDDAEIRLGAAYSLARIEDERGSEALLKLMGHWQQRISAAAALALAELGERRAIPALQAALYYPDDKVRQAARAALQRLGAGM